MSADAAFADTNLLVYAFDRAPTPKKEIASRLLTLLMEGDRLHLSTQVLQELFVTLTRKVRNRFSAPDALKILDDLAEWPLFVVDYDAIREASVLSGTAQVSFWDALIVVSAARSGARTLYTEDLNDGQTILGVQISNPFERIR